MLESVVEQFNTFYNRHGGFPDTYTELIGTPEPNGTVPYAPNKGDYHIHELTIEADDVVGVLNAPDSLSSDSYHDWTEHEIRFLAHSQFHEMSDAGKLKTPTLHTSEHGYTLEAPVAVSEQDSDTVEDRVLAVDLGVKKQATAVVFGAGEGARHEQVGPPTFVDHPSKERLFSLKADAEGINGRLAELRRQGKAHTERFAHLLSEFRQTWPKERRLRKQLQHDVATQLVWLAVEHGREAIVFELLARLTHRRRVGGSRGRSPRGHGATCWSSWRTKPSWLASRSRQ